MTIEVTKLNRMVIVGQTNAVASVTKVNRMIIVRASGSSGGTAERLRQHVNVRYGDQS